VFFSRTCPARSGGFFRKAAVIAILCLTACNKPAHIGDRLVFVPFEYQGSEAAAGWVGVALSGIASVQTGALAAPSIREAQTSNANVIEGVVTGGPGDFRVSAIVRDERSQQTLRAMEARGATAMEAATAIARQITSQPKPFGTLNNEAIRAYFSGRADDALALDPNFGAPHIAKIETLLRSGRKDELASAIAAARAAKLSDIDRARLEALVADTPKGRSDALLALARASRYDVQLWRAAAEAALTSKDHKVAIEAFRKALELDPINIVFWNTLAYAQTFAGDLEAAKRSIEEYRRLQPTEANPLDSLGELYFYEGRFADAEKAFLQAYALNNAALGGGELYRAALCRYLIGDRRKADDLVRQYLEFRQKHGDALVPVKEAVWLYTTGRRDEARQKIAPIATPAAKTQLAIWDIAEGKRPIAALGERAEFQGWRLLLGRRYPEAVEYWKRIYDSNSLVNGNEARVLLAWALTGANRAEEAASYLQKWPLPPIGPEPGFSSLWPAKVIELKVGHR
jgi:Flp pilus assembly protein TadD